VYTTRVPRIKICCIGSVDEARAAVQLGADALGLVSAMPSGPGVIPEALIAEIAGTVPPTVATFLLTSREDAPGIIAQQRLCRTNTIQICDCLSPDVYPRLRGALPGVA
jgi:phosphoribosylanthranilate isomerase